MVVYSSYKDQVKEVLENTKASIFEKETAIIKALPLPISEQLRKLFSLKSNRKSDADHIFYNSPDRFRLKQISVAYYTLVETITFVFMAQFWDVIQKEKIQNWELVALELRRFFLLDIKEKKEYSLIKICHLIYDVFHANGVVPFFKEWDTMKVSLSKDKVLGEAVDFMQKIIIKEGTYEADKIYNLCKEGEKHLANIFAKFGFIASYQMTSIQGVNVKQYRHKSQKVKFDHSVVNLISKFNEEDPIITVENNWANKPKYNDAVFIIRSDGKHLNLTPFVVDENSFNSKAPLAKICHFNLFEVLKNKKIQYSFTHVYNRDDNDLELNGEAEFNAIKIQLDAFRKIIFTNNIVS